MAANGVLRDPGFVRTSAPPTLLDQFGRALSQDMYGGAFNPPRDPLANEGAAKQDAVVVYRDIPLTTLAGNWEIDAVRSALADHRIGLFLSVAQLCDSVFGDDRVQATLGSRTGGLFSQPLLHRRSSAPAGKACRKAWRNAWAKAFPQSVMSEIVRWAVSIGFAIAEVLWDTSSAPWQPYLKVWHPMFCYYRWDIRQYVVITQDGPVAVMPGTGKWLLYTPHGAYRGWIQGAIRAIAQPWFIKQLAWRDWARFNERHGLPIIKALVPAAGDAKQKQGYIQSLQTLGQQAVVGLPQNVDGTGYDLQLLEARDRAWESFPATIDRCDRSIVLPILWQNLTTEVKEASLAAARMHGDVRQNAIEFDNTTLAEAIYRDVGRPFALFNFADPEAATYSHWNVLPIEDYVARSEALLKFSQAMQQLRQAGWAVEDLAKLAKTVGIDLGKIAKVDPVQVEARLAQATGKVDSPSELKGQLLKMRRDFAELSQQIRTHLKRAA